MFIAGGHECETVRDAGLGSKTNGELLTLAESRFDVLISIDKTFATNRTWQDGTSRY
jgi:hypothetical protein